MSRPRPPKRGAQDEDTDERLPAKQSKYEDGDVHGAIHSLQSMLLDNCDNEKFSCEFQKLIENRSRLKPWQIAWLNDSSTTGLTFLMLASKIGNVEIVKFLINCGLNVNIKDKQGFTASDYAWENQKLKCLLELLNADAPFPKNFDMKLPRSSEDDQKLCTIVSKMQTFHNNIKNGNTVEVESFVNANPKLRIAYNENNQCALSTALMFKRIKTYDLLQSKFYMTGVDSRNHNKKRKALSLKAKRKLRTSLKRNLGKPVEDHVMKLLSKSRDRSGSKDNFKKLIDFYQALNAIPQIRPILQIVAKSEKTNIVFDFNEKGVSCLDPTTKGNPFGLTYHSGYILIGAGREDPDVLATIAHELTHWAMQLTYKNKCQPFAQNDEGRKETYENIVGNCRKLQNLKEKCPEIAEVFELYDCDRRSESPPSETRNPSNCIDFDVCSQGSINTEPPSAVLFPHCQDSPQPAPTQKETKKVGKHRESEELIVRVPQLLAFYNNNEVSKLKLRALSLIFKDLFNYFEKVVLQDVEREMRLLDQKNEIREANKEFGVLKLAQESNYLSFDNNIRIDINQRLFIRTQLPRLVLESIVRSIKTDGLSEINAENIFIELEHVADGKNLEKLIKAAELEITPKFFIIDSTENCQHVKIDKRLLDLLQKLPVIFISSTEPSCFKDIFNSEKKIDFNWNDLNYESKENILESEIKFQGIEVKFNEIISNESLMENLPLHDILKSSAFKTMSFGDTLPLPPRVLVSRKFCYERHGIAQGYVFGIENLYGTDDLCDMLVAQRVILLADVAGMGKSTAAGQLARSLKQKYPSFWVVLIDLKQYIKALIPDHMQQIQCINVEFFRDKILKLGNNFAQRLFEILYNEQKVFFVIDGFDEISPKYKEFVKKMLECIKVSGNCLIVTTRTQFAKELENKLESAALMLAPFTKDDQIKFLRDYYLKNSEKNLSSQEYSKSESLSRKLDKRLCHFLFKSSLRLDIFFAIPIHIFMLAEVYDENDFDLDKPFTFDLYSLYKKFIDEKITIWTKKGPLALEDNNALQMTDPAINFNQIFKRISLEQLFDAKDLANLTLPEISEDISEGLIARVGIVAYGPNDTVELTHRTFAEYFVADFVFREALKINPQSTFVELFAKILLKNEFEQIRKFINDRLKSTAEKLETDALAKYISDLSNLDEENGIFDDSYYSFAEKLDDPNLLFDEDKKDRWKILFYSVIEQQTHLISFLLKTLLFDCNRKLKLVKQIFHLAVCYEESFATIWRCVEYFVDANDIVAVKKDLLSYRNAQNDCILGFAIKRDNGLGRASLRYILEVARTLLNEDEFVKFFYDEKTGYFPLRYSIHEPAISQEKFSILWIVARIKLSVVNQKRVLMGKNSEGMTCFHLGSRIGVCLDDYLVTIKDLLNSEDLNKLILARDNYGCLVSFRSVGIYSFKTIWAFIEENANLNTKKELILRENKDGLILIEELLYNSTYNTSEKIECIFHSTESLLEAEGKNIITYLRERDSLTDVILSFIVLSKVSFEKISKKLSSEELRQILVSKCLKRYNVFQLLAMFQKGYGKREADGGAIWSMVVDKIDDPELIKTFLFELDLDTKLNVFHVAIKAQNQIITTILNWCKMNFDYGSLKKIFTEIDDEGSTILHKAAKEEQNHFAFCFEFISEHFSPVEREQFLLIENKHGRTPLQMTFRHLRLNVYNTIMRNHAKNILKMCSIAFGQKKLKNIVSKDFFLDWESSYYSQAEYDSVAKLLCEVDSM